MYREYNRNYFSSRSDLGAVEIIVIINLVFFLPYISQMMFHNNLLKALLDSYCELNINAEEALQRV